MTVTAEGGLAEDAVVELGSVTKAVTGLLLADAVVRGEVGARRRRSTPACPAPGRGSRWRQLATHTAGLPRVPLALLRRNGFLGTTDPYARTTVARARATTSAHVRIRRRGRPHYSNLGAALLGQALAARAGHGYEALVHARDPRAARHHRGLGAGRAGARAAARAPRAARAAVVARRLRARGLPARHGARRAGARRGLPASRRPAWRRRCALALVPRARGRFVEHGLGWLESARHVVAQRRHEREPRLRRASGPQSGRAVAAVANSRRAPDRAAVAQLNS